MLANQKHYLGDGVYVHYDGYQIWLTTENGIETTNEIALDPQVLTSFIVYIKQVFEKNSL